MKKEGKEILKESMHYDTDERPKLDYGPRYPKWIQIPNIPVDHPETMARYLSVSRNANIEIIDDDGKSHHFTFYIGRYLTISAVTQGNKKPFWSTRFNGKDVKDFEIPPKNNDEELR